MGVAGSKPAPPTNASFKGLQEAILEGKTDTMLVDLLAQAKQQTDLVAAREMQRAKSELFASFINQKQRA